MIQLEKIVAREILDSRGLPTIEVDIWGKDPSGTGALALGRAAVPSGASTGSFEACELRDVENKKRFVGKGVLTAVENVNGELAKALFSNPKVTSHQLAWDQFLVELDGTEQKTRLGANALLGLSMAFAKLRANLDNKFLFQSLDGLDGSNSKDWRLPVPLMNLINGGKHANNGVDVQEFMIAPVCGGSFSEALRAGVEVFQALKKIIDQKGFSVAVGDEGGFAPPFATGVEALDSLMTAIEAAGYRPGEDIGLALDVASSELFSAERGTYTWEKSELTSDELVRVYADWCTKYPIWSIEDGCAEDDWSGWKQFTQSLGDRLQLVGDDLFVTNSKRIGRGIEEKVANALLVKPNQIGTLTETKRAIELAQKNGYRSVMSHRSGETEDTTIADLSVAWGCQQIKTGSPCRGERTAKYNQLLRIEQAVPRAEFWGRRAFRS